MADGAEYHKPKPSAKEEGTIDMTIKTNRTTARKSAQSTVQLPANSQPSPLSPALQREAKTALSSSKGRDEDDLDNSVDPAPLEGIRRVLIDCYCNGCHGNQNTDEDTRENHTSMTIMAAAADSVLKQLTYLQQLAIKKIDHEHSENSDLTNEKIGREKVWIPTAQLSLHMNSKENWTLLHRYVRQAFPLLRTETSSLGPGESDCSANRVDGGVGDSKGKSEDCGINVTSEKDTSKAWVCALIDLSFFPIAPYLSNPLEDLLSLYKFRNYGPEPASRKEGDPNRHRSRHCKWLKKNQRSFYSNQEQAEEEQSYKEIGEKASKVLLRLRPELPRCERRAIHHILASSRRREFETSTEHNVSLDYGDKSSKQTSAIAVQWSFNAMRASQKKRKRSGQGGDESKLRKGLHPVRSSTINAIFCVLQKHQCEHQVAIQNVVRALRCRSGDVGLAGIKDMQAITYQFCTLRNVDLRMLKRANDTLGKHVQLSSFVEVQDFLLDRGKLLGNRFEITIRNLKRVQRMHMEGEESWKERASSVDSSHLNAMVKRIQDFGFINFYGEQRVGDAGFRSHVGVRSFDIGRAMLQHDFTLAIDLIMTGRSPEVYCPRAEEMNAREVWKTSSGDARATLKAFPKNRNTMVRERDLMKGLLRYGDALEAIRCVPHNVRMYWIHSYQSYIWNRVATERVRRWGLRPVIGDLFIREHDSESDEQDGAAVVVQVVDDPDSINISQIVLPLPGYNVQYPLNDMGELYTKMLHDDGIQLVKNNKVPESTAKGSYRKLLQRASQLKWDIVSRKEGDHQLDPSDSRFVSDARLTFELRSGCYATMLLRELMVTTMAR